MYDYTMLTMIIIYAYNSISNSVAPFYAGEWCFAFVDYYRMMLRVYQVYCMIDRSFIILH